MFVSSADTSVSASGGDDQSLTAGSTHGSVQLIDDRPLLGAQRKIPLKRSGSPRPQKKNMQLAHVPTPEADYQEVPEMGDQDVSQHHTLLTSDQDRWKSSYKAPRDSVSSVESLYFNRTDESDDSISPASSPPSVTMGRSTQPAAPAKRPAPSTTMGNSALKSLKRSAQEDSFTTEISSKGGSNSSAALSKVLPSKLAIPQEASKSAPQPDSLITPLNLDSDVFFNEPEHSRTISGEVNTVSDYLSLISGSPGQLDSESAALDLRASESFNQTNDTAPRRSHSRGKSNTTLNALDTKMPKLSFLAMKRG
ncbi:hypothetical protein MMC20_006117 [Loxospora ochrophaea]|nr:hypothetical protein [Loxospora ochrophaea]